MKIDSGGYDVGGAYWGIGPPSMYVAYSDDQEYVRYLRATSRAEAVTLLKIPKEMLKYRGATQ